MARNINSVTLTGNLTRDPELRALPSGTSVCELGIAVNESFKNRTTGEWEERANFFQITVWGAQGEACAQYLSKGRPVAVQGKLRYESWETQDGDKRSRVKVVADTVQFLGSRDGGGNGGDGFDPEPYRSDVPADTTGLNQTGSANTVAGGVPSEEGGGAPDPAAAYGPSSDDDIPF
jgi:single-strand DNA-binding protein